MEEKAFIDLTIVSGRDIKRNGWLLPGADQKIAVAWVNPNAKRSTKPAMKGGGTVPEWEEKLMIPLYDDRNLTGLTLTIEIRSKGPLGDVLLGTVYIPVAEIAMDAPDGKNRTPTTYQVQQPSGKRHGSLTIIANIVTSQQKIDVHENFRPIAAVNPPQNSSSNHQFATPYPPVVYPRLEEELPESYRFSQPYSQPYPPPPSYYPPLDYSYPPPSYPPPPPPQYPASPYPPPSYYPPTHYPPPPQCPCYPPQYPPPPPPQGYNPYPPYPY